MNRKCIYCKEEKPQEFFAKSNGVYRNECKKCKSEKECKRIASMSKGQLAHRKRIEKEYYHKCKNRLLTEEISFEEKIDRWCKQQLRRKGFDRSRISEKVLKEKCYEAKANFNYITFLNLSEIGNSRSGFASIDKIDPNGIYEDANIRVIPLWLNSAKLDQTEQELIAKMKHFLKLKNDI